jgi:hypothetical protein
MNESKLKQELRDEFKLLKQQLDIMKTHVKYLEAHIKVATLDDNGDHRKKSCKK